MKALSVLPALLLMAACVAGNPGADDRGFAAADTATDVVESTPRATPVLQLTPNEEAEAALLIAHLERTEELSLRDQILLRLIALGPRYLPYFRRVDNESVLLEMLYVIQRIESGQQPVDQVSREKTPEPARNPGEDAGRGRSTAPGDYNREDVERYFALRLKEAQHLLEIGRYESATRIAEAAITMMPDSRSRPEFESVILRARGAAQSDLIVGTMTLEPELVQYAENSKGSDFAQAVQIRCFLKNVSMNPITLRLQEGDGKRSIVRLAVRLSQTDYLGTALSQQGNVSLPVDAGASIRLEPGASYELAVPLAGLSSLDPDAPLKLALGIAEIDAALHVYGALDHDGKTLVLKPVRFTRQSVRIFPAEFDLAAATEKPLTQMRELITRGRTQEIFLCAHLIDTRHYRNAGDILTGEDFADCPIGVQRARLRALHVLFKTGAAWDMRQWRQWWTENRLRH